LSPGKSLHVIDQRGDVAAAHGIGEVLQPRGSSLDILGHGGIAVVVELLRSVARGIGHAVDVVGEAHLALFDI
jgi:hypothetical protein